MDDDAIDTEGLVAWLAGGGRSVDHVGDGRRSSPAGTRAGPGGSTSAATSLPPLVLKAPAGDSVVFRRDAGTGGPHPRTRPAGRERRSRRWWRSTATAMRSAVPCFVMELRRRAQPGRLLGRRATTTTRGSHGLGARRRSGRCGRASTTRSARCTRSTPPPSPEASHGPDGPGGRARLLAGGAARRRARPSRASAAGAARLARREPPAGCRRRPRRCAWATPASSTA